MEYTRKKVVVVIIVVVLLLLLLVIVTVIAVLMVMAIGIGIIIARILVIVIGIEIPLRKDDYQQRRLQDRHKQSIEEFFPQLIAACAFPPRCTKSFRSSAFVRKCQKSPKPETLNPKPNPSEGLEDVAVSLQILATHGLSRT